MRLTSSYSWVANPVQHSIADAVDLACTPDYSEDTAEHAGNTSKMLGRLVEKLHEKGLLDNADVLAVIGHGWKEAEPPQ